MKWFRSLKHALTANFILLACLPVMLFGGFIHYLWGEHLQRMAKDTNLRLAHEVRSDAEFFLVEARRELKQISTVLDRSDMLPEEKIDDYLGAVTQNSLSFEAVLLLDSSWKVTHLGLSEEHHERYRDFINIDMSKHELLAAGPLDKPRWSSTFLSLVSGNPTVTLGVPLSRGVLIGNVSLKNLSATITRLVQTVDHASLAILGSDKNVIVSNRQEEVYEQVNFGFHPEVLRALGGEDGTQQDTHGGVLYLESVVVVPETSWVVWVGQDLEKVMAPASALSATLLIFMGGTLLVALMAAVRKANLLMQPLQALLERTIEVGSGVVHGPLPESRYREIDILAAGMQEMFEAISEREISLRDSEERFRLVFSLSPDATCLTRFSDGRVVDVNEAFLLEYGQGRDEVLGKDVGKLRLWGDPRQWNTLQERLRLRRKVINREVDLRTVSGNKIALASATMLDISGESYVLVMLRDISEIREAEARLRSSESRYRTVVESIEEGLMVFDQEGFMTTCNAAAEQFLGPREEYLGSSYLEWGARAVHADGSHWSRREVPVARSLSRGEVVRNAVMGISREGGTQVWFEVNSSPLRGADHRQISGAVVTMVDVTERKLREELLDNIARGIASQTGTPFFDSLTQHLAKALDADFVLVSEIHPDKPGFFRSISVTSPWGGTENIEYAQQGTPCFEALNEETCVYASAVQEKFPDDHLLVEMGVHAYVGRALHSEQGEPIGLIAVMYQRPIGEVVVVEQLLQIFAARAEAELVRRQSVEALRISEKQLRRLSSEFEALLEGIPDQILLVDRDYRLIWGNHIPSGTFGENLGYCHQVFYERNDPCENCPVSRAFESGKVEESDFTDDEGRCFTMRAVPILPAEGRVEKVIQMVQDVTEKVRLQQQQQHTGQLAALGELAAGVAHEINNPVNGIINYAQLIQNRFGENESLHGLTERVIREGNRIATIVGELLYFAREGGDEVRITTWQEIVDEALLLVGNQLRKDHVQLDIDIDPELPKVQSIATQLQQVVLNLFSNARHALNEKYGEFDENKRVQIVGRRRTDDLVELEITDFGSGIPETDLNKVLQPFYTTKPAGIGTGLGLSICHEIIKRHSGSVELASEVGKFTRVTILLPGVSAESGEVLRNA